MPYRMVDSALAGWAAISGGVAVLARMAEGVIPASLPGGEYFGEMGALAAVLVFLWKVGERVGRTVIEQGGKGGGRLLKFLEDKDAKDRQALREFGERVDGSVKELAAAHRDSAIETRVALERLSEQFHKAQATPAARTTKRRNTRQNTEA